MKRTLHALLLALFLAAIGLAIFIHKLVVSDIPLLPNQTFDSWYLEAKISLVSQPSVLSTETDLPTNIRFQLPQESQRYEIAKEDFVNQGFNREVKTETDGVNRIAVFKKQDATNNDGFIFYRANINRKTGFFPIEEDVPISGRRLVDKQLVRFGENTARVEDNLEENLPAPEIIALIKQANTKSNGDRLTFVKEIYQIALNTDDIRIQTISQNVRKPESTVQIAKFLLDRAEVSARVGNGIFLRGEEVYSTDFIEWLEVKQGDRWLVFDPVDGNFKQQDRYLTWWYGTNRVLTAEGAGGVDLSVVVQPNTNQGLTRSVWQDGQQSSPFLEYSFLRLPLTTQRVIQILILIPLGALIISILHQIIGLSTFGTFTPILISLAFRQTGLGVGIGLFVLVVIIGLLFRSYLNQLQLLIVPRLASILTATVLIIGLLAIVMESLEINLGLSVSLFPIVILAMTIERASTMWEEDGAKETIIAGVGTIIAALIGYFCMVNDYVQHWLFVFPELLLVVLGVNILMGRYNGYKLTEYYRFMSLQKQLEEGGH
ncbi:MAG: UUP1 family membrane protein [Cyanobacteriota bacterium]|nr:UUP1 family membrane protein [Cyanobacteriota bacterium]